MSKQEKRLPPAVEIKDQAMRQAWQVYLRLGLGLSTVMGFLTACAQPELINQDRVFAELNSTRPVITEVVQETELATEAADPTLIPEITVSPTPKPETSEVNEYFAQPYELNEYQQRAMESLVTGSMIEIQDVKNGIDDCSETKCFRVPIRVEVGLANLSEVASGKEIVGYRPESPVSSDSAGYTPDSEIVSWPNEVFFNIHNRANYPWLIDSAWAQLENLELGRIITVTSQQGEVFEFQLVKTMVLPRSSDLYRQAMSSTREFGGARIVLMSCTQGGADNDQLWIGTAIPVEQASLKDTLD